MNLNLIFFFVFQSIQLRFIPYELKTLCIEFTEKYRAWYTWTTIYQYMFTIMKSSESKYS